ncbi:MAG TPA: acyl-CoA synthetase [Burkholderiaceae bacterium]|nr:acyl-CoA synthetase [Burkholderiaceae bacterium]
MPSIYDQDLPQTPANYAAISPLSFIERSAEVYPQRLAVVHGSGPQALRRTWSELYSRCRQLASALTRAGIGKADTVAVMLPNTPAMVEVHFGVPMAGAVLNALNTRLDPAMIAFMLDHGEAKVVMVDREFSPVMKQALALRTSTTPIQVIDVADALYTGDNPSIGSIEYEDFIRDGDPEFPWELPDNEWDAISLNYTSGTTGNPKGVVYHHRGAAAAAISNILEWDMPKHAVYLWTLPMFHCNGWTFPWAIAARAGVNVCLRRVEAQAIFDAMREHGVTHYCGAPIVHSLLVNAPDSMKEGVPKGVNAMVAGAAPPASMIEGMERMGFDLLHVYGLTEVYGPATVCAKHEIWDDLDIGERARLNSRQGVTYHLERGISVMNPQTMEPVPADGETMGEVMFRGNVTMKGYLKNPKATQEALAGGWFHSGDLAVMDPDGYIKVKDRSKDIIISGGENISSIEVEDVLYRHPDVLAAAVVARPDTRWGETPCAFIELKEGSQTTAESIIAHCKKHMAGYKVPRTVVFGELPKTATGKIQKFALRKQAEALDTVAG